jgi:tellurite resistance protein
VVFVGFRYHFRIIGQGTLHCQRCGGDRHYRKCAGRRWFHLLFVPVIAFERVEEHVQCTSCGTRYRREILALPTTAQMRTALPAATRAAVVAMVCAGDDRSATARACAVARIRVSGMRDYGDPALAADIMRSEAAGSEVASALGTLAMQLTMPAHEWFLADVVRVGLADGPLSDEERYVAGEVAACLGMTPAQAHGVISMTEESAAAG